MAEITYTPSQIVQQQQSIPNIAKKSKVADIFNSLSNLVVAGAKAVETTSNVNLSDELVRLDEEYLNILKSSDDREKFYGGLNKFNSTFNQDTIGKNTYLSDSDKNYLYRHVMTKSQALNTIDQRFKEEDKKKNASKLLDSFSIETFSDYSKGGTVVGYTNTDVLHPVSVSNGLINDKQSMVKDESSNLTKPINIKEVIKPVIDAGYTEGDILKSIANKAILDINNNYDDKAGNSLETARIVEDKINQIAKIASKIGITNDSTDYKETLYKMSNLKEQLVDDSLRTFSNVSMEQTSLKKFESDFNKLAESGYYSKDLLDSLRSKYMQEYTDRVEREQLRRQAINSNNLSAEHLNKSDRDAVNSNIFSAFISGDTNTLSQTVLSNRNISSVATPINKNINALLYGISQVKTEDEARRIITSVYTASKANPTFVSKETFDKVLAYKIIMDKSPAHNLMNNINKFNESNKEISGSVLPRDIVQYINEGIPNMVTNKNVRKSAEVIARMGLKVDNHVIDELKRFNEPIEVGKHKVSRELTQQMNVIGNPNEDKLAVNLALERLLHYGVDRGTVYNLKNKNLTFEKTDNIFSTITYTDDDDNEKVIVVPTKSLITNPEDITRLKQKQGLVNKYKESNRYYEPLGL